ncbi:hypothetical protein [Nonomuraea zeae]|uniref:Uncharacterized protein n=1 Tax=Nonomuraea zeae TaxID=1642303 RepID=A0A5S4G177_9ACTN|nr:hypothetical protein [Nonomuraea zeae]TMR18593.1 hypothetical protein ETD85_53520 [Nonomuraea zeae]
MAASSCPPFSSPTRPRTQAARSPHATRVHRGRRQRPDDLAPAPESALARLDQDRSRIIVTDGRTLSTLDSSGTSTIRLPAPLRTATSTGTLTPDGAGQAAQVLARNPAAGGTDIRPARLVTIDTRDGKIRHDARLRLALSDRASACHTRHWVSASEVLLSCGMGSPFDETTFRVNTRTGAHANVTELHPPRPHLFDLVRAEG